jgi:hypothetical protein
VTGNTTITISGTPTQLGVYSFTLYVTDAAGVTVNRTYSLTINAAPSVGTPISGTYNTTYSNSVSITGGTAPFKITGVPAGLSVSGATLSAGVYTLSGSIITLTGKPTAAGIYALSITDAAGAATSSNSFTINAAATSVVLSSSTKYWVISQATVFTAAVTSPSGATPIGTASYTVNGPAGYTYTSGALTLSAGKATFPAFVFPATIGTYIVTVNYTPTGNNFQSSSTAPTNTPPATPGLQTEQYVAKASSITMTASPNPASTSTAVTFTAVLSGTNILSTTPAQGGTGTVQFYSNGVLIGTGTAVPSQSSANSVTYKFTWTTPSAAGTYAITAVYSGDANFDPAGLTTPLSLSVKAQGRLD